MSTGSTDTFSSSLTIAPLPMAFLLSPIAVLLAKAMGFVSSAENMRVFDLTLWLILCGLAPTLSFFKKNRKKSKPFRRSDLRTPFLMTVIFAVVVLALFRYLPSLLENHASFVPFLHEAKPVIFLMFAAAWAWTFGLPDRGTIQRSAACLGVLVVCDTLWSMLTHSPPLLVGRDILATLLLAGLCASLKPGRSDGGEEEPDQGKPLWRFWIMLGLVATFSRTGLFTAAWIYAFFGRGSTWKRFPYVMLCVLALAAAMMSDIVPGNGSSRFMEYWVWLECVEKLVNSGRVLTGFPLEIPLDIVPPLDLVSLWRGLFATPPFDGLYIHQIDSFWVRTVMAWGILPPLMLLAILFGLLMRTVTRLGAGLVAVCLAQGIGTELFHSPGPAIVLFLALMLAFQKVVQRNTQSGDVSNGRTPESEAVSRLLNGDADN